MSYRDYEKEEEDRKWKEDTFKKELQRVEKMLEEGKLAELLTNLLLYKQPRM